jgi:hypothetical protein
MQVLVFITTQRTASNGSILREILQRSLILHAVFYRPVMCRFHPKEKSQTGCVGGLGASGDIWVYGEGSGRTMEKTA